MSQRSQVTDEVVVVNNDGKEVLLDSVLTSGKRHKQARERQHQSLQYNSKKENKSSPKLTCYFTSQKKFTAWLNKACKYTDTSRKKRIEFPDKNNHSLELLLPEKVIRCRCCAVAIVLIPF